MNTKKCVSCGKEKKWGKFADKHELQSGFCPDCFNKPFTITSVTRADLTEEFTPAEIKKFTDADMSGLASDMADAYSNNGFWQDLEISAESILDEK